MNMPIQIKGDSHDGIQMEVISWKGPKKNSESIRQESHKRYKGQKTKPNGANDVSNRFQMTLTSS